MHGRGMCVAGGVHGGEGSVHGRRGVCDRGVCMAGGMHGGGNGVRGREGMHGMHTPPADTTRYGQ